jgi:hypothetical protein
VLENKGGEAKKAANSRPLERHPSPSHITIVQATTSVSKKGTPGLHDSPARWRAGN